MIEINYIDKQKNNMKKNIIILIYMSLECNLRCYYCVVNFKKEYISCTTIDDILHFIKKNRNEFNDVSIEFFGWEPLLVFDKIKYFVDAARDLDLSYKITTNGLLINQEILTYFNDYFTSVYISFNNLDFKTLKNYLRIFPMIWKDNIGKYSITFIYHPSICVKEHIKYMNTLIDTWYININILPIYMYKNYTQEEFENLEVLLKYTKWIQGINFDYFYFIVNKNDLEFSISPNWLCSLDSWETIYDMKKNGAKDLLVGEIRNIDKAQLIKKISDFHVGDYMKDFLDKNFVEQDYNNFMKLSDLLHKYI